MKRHLSLLLALPLLCLGCNDSDDGKDPVPKFENLTFANAKGYYHGQTAGAPGYYEVIIYSGTIDEKNVLTGEGRQLTLCLYSGEKLQSGKYSIGGSSPQESTFAPGSSSGGTKFRVIDKDDNTYNITGGELSITVDDNRITDLGFSFTSGEVKISGSYGAKIEIEDLTVEPGTGNKIENITFGSAHGYYYGKTEGQDAGYYEVLFYTGTLNDNDELTGDGNLLKLCLYSGEELKAGNYTAGSGDDLMTTFVPGSTEGGTKLSINDDKGNIAYSITGGNVVITKPSENSVGIDFEFTTSSGWELSGTFIGPVVITDILPPVQDPQPEGFTRFNYAFADYYGDQRETGTGMFRIVLTDIDNRLNANESIWLVGFCDLADDPDNFQLPVGTYTLDGTLSGSPFTLWGGTKDEKTGYLDNTYYYNKLISGRKAYYLADGAKVTVSKQQDHYTIAVELDTYRSILDVERKDGLKYYYFGEIDFVNNVLVPDPEFYTPDNLILTYVTGGWPAEHSSIYKTPGIMGIDLQLQSPTVNGILDDIMLCLNVPSYTEQTNDIKELLPAGTYIQDTGHDASETFKYLPGLVQGSRVSYSKYTRRLGTNAETYINASLEEGEVVVSYPREGIMKVEGIFTGKNRLTGQDTTTDFSTEVEISSVDIFIMMD